MRRLLGTTGRIPRTAWRAGAVVVAALTAIGVVAVGASAATLFADDFEDGDSNGWSKSGGTWSVGADGSRALRQTSASADLARVFAGQTNWTNYAVQVRVKPAGYGTTGFAGIAARSNASTSFDRLVLHADRVELQAVRSGAVTVLGATPLALAPGTWATLRIEASGGTVRGLFNGTVVGTGPSQSTKGRVGLQTYRATASFDDVTVDTGSTPEPTPTTVSPTPSESPTPTPTPSDPPPGGDELFVAPTGDDANPGSIDQPLGTLHRAVELATPGTTIQLRAGTYAPATNIRIMKDGTAATPYTITAYRGEKVILDGENMPHTPAPLDASIPNLERGALHIEADYWRVVNIEIANGPYAIFCRDCNNNVFDRLTTRDNYESGLHIQAASSNNQVLNLDSYGNRDPRKNGESADGLAIKEGSGSGNVVRGARLWNNSDDGFDAWEFLSPIVIEDSVAWGNGFNRWNLPGYTGDGNGWKLGGGDEDLPAAHVVRNSIAFDNAVGGFIDNANPGQLVLDHNTAWRNGGTGFDVADADAEVTKNLAVENETQVALGSSTSVGNSWDLGGTWTLADTDPSTITGPRTASGEIPSSNFLRPANGADVGARI
ncbi:right-handed parallel beta-helix repeat-containing protein [Plantactinospora solaniradicis]|uniref:Right-handed parallel beta-helix repeat-containing protein n=1 Tax=Plantactinospora solaniradicis TaxID=1723736 RepID=A0ABW1K6F8_9ACTN